MLSEAKELLNDLRTEFSFLYPFWLMVSETRLGRKGSDWVEGQLLRCWKGGLVGS
jgi:hypothetical protein